MNKIQSIGQWSDISAALNQNFEVIAAKLSQLYIAAWKALGVYPTKSALEQAAPSPPGGTYAYVGSGNSYNLYIYDGGWTTTGDTLTASQVLIPAFDWKNAIPQASDSEDGYMSKSQAQLLSEAYSGVVNLGGNITNIQTSLNKINGSVGDIRKSVDQHTTDITTQGKAIKVVQTTLTGQASILTENEKTTEFVNRVFGGEEIYESLDQAYDAAVRIAQYPSRVLMVFSAGGQRGIITQAHYGDGARQHLTLGQNKYTRIVTGSTATEWTPIIDAVEYLEYDSASGVISMSSAYGKLSTALPLPALYKSIDSLTADGIQTRDIAYASAPKLAGILDYVTGEINVEESIAENYEVVFARDKKCFLARIGDTYYAEWQTSAEYQASVYYGAPGELGPVPVQSRLYVVDDDIYIWTAGEFRVATNKRIADASIELKKRTIDTVDVNELDGLTTPVFSALGKADYWLTKTYGNQPLIIGRVFMLEDPFMHKITQVVLSNQILDENYPNGGHTSKSLTVCYRFYGQTNSDVPMKQWTPWKKIYDSGDTKLERAGEFLSKLETAFGTVDLDTIVSKLASLK